MDDPQANASRNKCLHSWTGKLVIWFVVLATLAAAGIDLLRRGTGMPPDTAAEPAWQLLVPILLLLGGCIGIALRLVGPGRKPQQDRNSRFG